MRITDTKPRAHCLFLCLALLSCAFFFFFLFSTHSSCLVHLWDSSSNLSVPSCFSLFGRDSLSRCLIGLLLPTFCTWLLLVVFSDSDVCVLIVFAPLLPPQSSVHRGATLALMHNHTHRQCRQYKHMLHTQVLSVYEYGSLPNPTSVPLLTFILAHICKYQCHPALIEDYFASHTFRSPNFIWPPSHFLAPVRSSPVPSTAICCATVVVNQENVHWL